MNDDATLYALLILGLALVWLGLSGRAGVMAAAILAPTAVQEA